MGHEQPAFRPSVTVNRLIIAGMLAATQPLVAAEPVTSVSPVVVSGTRTETDVSEIARSITVVDREQIEEQTRLSRNLGDILAETVPGLAPSTEAVTNFGQTLRGRKFLVLVDGIPQSTPLRDASRGLNTISPASVERVEVVRGGTAVYGFGATGGVINIITKAPAAEPVEGHSQVGTRFSTTHFDESVDYETEHRVSGTQGRWDYLLSGSYVDRGGRFDADGDRIPPDPLGTQGGFADTREYSLLAKTGLDFDGGDQRIEVMVNHLDNKQDSDFTFGLNLDDGRTPAVPLDEAGDASRAAVDPGTKNTTGRISYRHHDLAGSDLQTKAYVGDLSLIFPKFPGFDQGGIDSRKYGARTTVDTPLNALGTGAALTWGADFLRDDTEADSFGDGAVVTTPEMSQDAVAGFAELEAPLGNVGLLRGGLRHEDITVDVDPVVNRFGNNVRAGELEFSETLFNAGAVFYLGESLDLFTSFSQGFSIADIGRVLRGAGPQDPDITLRPKDFESEVQTVDNYEIGLRHYGDALSASAAVFYSESDNGSTFDDELRLRKRDEEIWGVEAQAAYRVTPRYTLGGTLSWADGQRLDDSGDQVRLDGTRIAPVKVTAYLEQQATAWWHNRLQALYVGHRDEFPEADGPSTFTGFGQGEVNSYFLVNAISRIDAGPGTLSLSVSNLFNEDYFPAINQAFNTPTAQSKGTGRRVAVSYEVNW